MFNIKKQPLYDKDAVQPMRDEVVYVGFEELTTAESVEVAFEQNKDKTVLFFINSVCGCAAGSARPGVTAAVQHDLIPDKLFTVFAGQDRESVDYLRTKYLSRVVPSSPSMFLFKNGELVFALPRLNIEGFEPEAIASLLNTAFDEFCTKQGPSITNEKYEQLVSARVCGSSIPLNSVN
ncbi:MAG: BrxA/BrxB family bacilliredoxin [bacterium]